MEVGIIGGGMMGLATAFYLARRGVRVTVLEKEKEIGGLSRSEEIVLGLRWDRFYHVILPTDEDLLTFIDEIGLAPDVRFTEAKTGFYTDENLHSMSSIKDFLSFKPLSLWDKLRLGTGILYASRINSGERLEKTYAKVWLIRVFGRRNYEKMWEPLLRSKLGEAKVQASAFFIWACIKRYYGTRHERSKKELLGCILGGYQSILDNIKEKLIESNSTILSGHSVKKLEPLSGDRLRIYCKDGKKFDFDRVVATIPSPYIIRLWPSIPTDFRALLERVRYLNLVCATLLLKKSMTPFYVTNLTDPGFPFTGLIEASNVIPGEALGNKALIYLPRYMPPTDPFFEKSNEEVLNIFINSLRRIFLNFSDHDIISSHVNRERYVQPIQEVNYSENIPPMKTPLKNFYIVNTTMIINSTLNNNQVIQLARRMANLLLNQ
jgi:protoporphyrinogen oxidase